MNDPVARLRVVGLAEGVSFLVLLGIAMPLKYAFGMPLAVKWVGWAHGLLFVAYAASLAVAFADRGWKLKHGALLFLASLVPGGPFFAEPWLRRQQVGR